MRRPSRPAWPPRVRSSATGERRARLRRATCRDPRPGRLVRAADRWPRRLRPCPGGRRPVRAARRDGARPGVQAGHPIPRPSRRPALLPDGADAAGRRPAAARSIVDRRRRPPQPGRWRRARRPASRVGRGAGRRLRPGLPPRRAAQRRHDRGRGGPHRGGLRRRCRRPIGRDPRDRQADRLVRRAGRGRRGRRPARDMEPAGVRVPRGIPKPRPQRPSGRSATAGAASRDL